MGVVVVRRRAREDGVAVGGRAAELEPPQILGVNGFVALQNFDGFVHREPLPLTACRGRQRTNMWLTGLYLQLLPKNYFVFINVNTCCLISYKILLWLFLICATCSILTFVAYIFKLPFFCLQNSFNIWYVYWYYVPQWIQYGFMKFEKHFINCFYLHFTQCPSFVRVGAVNKKCTQVEELFHSAHLNKITTSLLGVHTDSCNKRQPGSVPQIYGQLLTLHAGTVSKQHMGPRIN